MKAPTFWELKDLIDSSTLNTMKLAMYPTGSWYPARPLGYDSIPHRLRCAWLVLTGRADAVVWPADQ